MSLTYNNQLRNGHACAAHNLANLYLDGHIKKSSRAAVKLFRKAADRKCATAQAQLGIFHYYGQYGVEQDFDQAFALFQASADQSHPEGTKSLAGMYSDGLGPVRSENVAKAEELYRVAADLGSINAMSNLGLLFSLQNEGTRSPLKKSSLSRSNQRLRRSNFEHRSQTQLCTEIK